MAKTEEKKTEQKNLVKIKLFKDSYKYKDDVFVGCNGKTWQIQRGVEEEVPEVAAQIIEQSIKQDNATAALIERESNAAKSADALL